MIPKVGGAAYKERVDLESGNNYWLDDVVAGTYDIVFTGCQWMPALVTDKVITAGTINTCDAPLANGDVNGDNSVTSTDLNALIANIDQKGD